VLTQESSQAPDRRCPHPAGRSGGRRCTIPRSASSPLSPPASQLAVLRRDPCRSQAPCPTPWNAPIA